MRDLTARQQEILGLIRQHIADTGFPPTRAEIAAKLGFRSPNAAEAPRASPPKPDGAYGLTRIV